MLAAEFGTLYMYRSGWDVAVGGLAVSVASALVLVPIGVLFFSEHLNCTKVIGVALSIAGLALISYRSQHE